MKKSSVFYNKNAVFIRPTGNFDGRDIFQLIFMAEQRFFLKGNLDITQLDVIQRLTGMVSSLLCVTGAGLAIQVAGNAMINSAADLADQLTDNKNGIEKVVIYF